MKKGALLFFALVILVGYAAKDLGAAELCWRVDGWLHWGMTKIDCSTAPLP